MIYENVASFGCVLTIKKKSHSLPFPLLRLLSQDNWRITYCDVCQALKYLNFAFYDLLSYFSVLYIAFAVKLYFCFLLLLTAALTDFQRSGGGDK